MEMSHVAQQICPSVYLFILLKCSDTMTFSHVWNLSRNPLQIYDPNAEFSEFPIRIPNYLLRWEMWSSSPMVWLTCNCWCDVLSSSCDNRHVSCLRQLYKYPALWVKALDTYT